jgi:hypothetical protein
MGAVVSFTPCQVDPYGNMFQLPLDRRLGEPKTQSEHNINEKISGLAGT